MGFLKDLRRHNPAAKLVWTYGMIEGPLGPCLAEAVERFRRESGELSAFVLDSLRGLDETIQYGQGEARLAQMNARTDALSESESKMKRKAGYSMAVTNTVILLLDLAMLFT